MVIRAVVFGVALAFFATGCRKTSIGSEDASVVGAGMIVDVVQDGAPKVTGTGDVAEIRGVATTPWKRAAMGADTAKMRRAQSVAFVAGDKRTKPIALPKASSGELQPVEFDKVDIDKSGSPSLNGLSVASAAELGRSLAGAPSRMVILAADANVELEKVLDVVGTIQALGRPIAFSIER